MTFTCSCPGTQQSRCRLTLPPLHPGHPQVLEGELSRVPSFLAKENNTQLWSILYLPQVGYVVQVSGQPLSGESAQAPAQLA